MTCQDHLDTFTERCRAAGLFVLRPFAPVSPLSHAIAKSKAPGSTGSRVRLLLYLDMHTGALFIQRRYPPVFRAKPVTLAAFEFDDLDQAITQLLLLDATK